MTSLNTVSTVFGGTAPHRLKELYGVDFAEGGAAPASGAINLLAFTGKSPVLYAFTQHTFTSAGQSGRTGPTLAQCRNAYTVPWDTNTTFFNVSQGIQEWTVPGTATYRIGAKGAQGGGGIGGKGAYIQGDFSLTKGAIVKILIGQQPDIYTSLNSPGGGGTFVTVAPHNMNSAILVVAGGGGGSYNNSYGDGTGGNGVTGTSGGYSNGVSTTTGGPVASAGTPGSNGLAGSGEPNITVQSGAGFSGDTTNNLYFDGVASYRDNFAHVLKAKAYVNGGTGGVMNLRGPNANSPDPFWRGEGGFGGGGGSGRSGSTNYGPMGGGGGYSGGASGYNASHGGGGGSYNNGSNKVETAGSSSESSYGNGYVTITLL